MAKQFGLGKREKLKSRKGIEELFASGKSLNVFPVRVSYKFFPILNEEEPGVQIGVTASRRNFKRAVDRNRIKRLIREAYRLQKAELLLLMKEKGLKGHVFFIYSDKKLPDYKTIFATMTKCLGLLQKKAGAFNEEVS